MLMQKNCFAVVIEIVCNTVHIISTAAFRRSGNDLLIRRCRVCVFRLRIKRGFLIAALTALECLSNVGVSND